MNLCRAFPAFVLLCSAVGGAIAYFTGAPLLRGISIGLFVGMTPMALLGITYALMMAWRPDRPVCRCDKCQSEDYKYVGPEHIDADTIYEYQCPFCYRTYRQKDSRFWEIRKDGSEVPYMAISNWGRWQSEDSEPTLSADSDKPHR